MLNSLRFRTVVSLTLILFVVLAGFPVSAAERMTAPPPLGEVSGTGDVQVIGNHIRTGDSSTANVVLSNGNTIRLSSRADIDLSGADPEIRLRMTAGEMGFDASNNRLAITIGPYEILPEASSSGSIAFIEGNQAALQVLTGNVKFRNSVENTDIVISGGSELVVPLSAVTQIAANIPTPFPGARSQDPGQTPPAQRPANLPTVDPEQQPPAARPANLPTTDPEQQPPAARPANLPTATTEQQPPATRPANVPTSTAAKAGSKTLPILVGVGGGAAAAVFLAAKGSSSSNETPAPPSCSPSCPQAPTISALTPSSGNVGSTVSISGSNFGATQGTSSVTFNSITATAITSWSATSIVAVVPGGTTTGNVVVTTSVGASNSLLFTVTATPLLTSLTPNSGTVGSQVTIAGTNFGATQGTSAVTFNGTTATTITSWTATSIVALVPSGATTGNVVVTTSTGVSNGLLFTVTVPPVLTTLTPNSGPVGSLVTIAGTNFAATQGTSTVAFNGTVATINSWSATAIVAAVPTGASTGNVVVTTLAGPSNGLSFTVNPSTTITSLTPNNGPVGFSVTIAGTNFGTTQGTSTVTFNGTVATSITSWSASSIVAVVPAAATTGPVVVTTTAGGPSNGVAFTVLPSATISSLTPNSGPLASTVTIAGANFGATQGTSTVTFNGTVATSIINWSGSSIVAVVPTGATTGPVVVSTNAGPSNGVTFTVNPSTTITSLTPNNGIVGSSVTIAGSNFGATQGTSTVTFNGTAATSITSWSAASIVAVVPAGATTGFVVVTTTTGGPSNGATFTVNPPTTISSLTPNTGPVGSSVTIAGANFGATKGTSTVTFNGTLATSITSWSATSIVAVVPTGATTGPVVVTTTAGGPSNGVAFSVSPSTTITSLTPNNGPVGSSVTIAGANFGATQGSSSVIFNGTSATSITSWSATSIVAVVPVGATTGAVVVTTTAGGPSNGAAFTVNPPTSITSLTPNNGPVGSSVTIAGANFGATQGSSTVRFNGTTATSISLWSATSIIAVVPVGATNGSVVVTTTAGGPSNGVTFTVNLSPTITNLTPNSGPEGTSVTITGANFGSTQGSGEVKFNGTAAPAISTWSDSSIVVAVPIGASSGNVVVTTAAGGSSNGVLFTVTSAPTITSLTPNSGPVGTSVTIAGNSFGAAQGSSEVTFNGISASITSWSDTSIVAVVPVGAISAPVFVFTAAGGFSNDLPFTVTPAITNLSPDTGPEGATVTITGTTFGFAPGTSSITFNGMTATTISNWSDTSIDVEVPTGATTGDVVVTTAEGASNGQPFTVDNSGMSGMSIMMMADHSVVAPGDPVGFSFNVSNPSETPLSLASLNSNLPVGFSYTAGSATIHIIGSKGEELAGQAITPIISSDRLVFPIGVLAAGARISIRYSAVVQSDARPGEHRSGALGIANLSSGKRVNSNSAQVRVVVTPGAFTLTQVLIGRVFDDRNRNGSYDGGESGVANVRVVTSSGQTATTDSDGLYNLPSLSAGSVLVALDPSTLPPGFQLPPKESRLGGAGQLLRTPLEGGGLLRQNFALIQTTASNASGGPVPSPASSKDTPGRSESGKLEFVIERPVMSAGAYDKQLIRIRARDDLDRNASMSITVSTATGAIMAASKVADQYACESVLSLEQRPDLSREVVVDTDGGEATVCLVSDVSPSTTRLIASSSDRQFSATADVRFEATQHPALLVAMGEIGIGLSGPGQNATDSARRVDGLASVFYQKSLTKKDLLSVAVRSKESVNSASGNSGLFEFDPTQRIYPVMGDASTRQELGQSASRVYARYDRGRSYVMYGDLHGDTPSEGRSSLLEFNRNVTGFRFQIQTENPSNWLQGQVARPKTGYMREISSALTGSAVRLSQSRIIPGSEAVRLEIRDRRNPERILSRETLVRNLDYSLDPLSGTLFMMRSTSLFDPSLNLVQLVSTYEYETTGVNSAMYLGRGSYAVNRLGMRLGLSLLSQNTGGAEFSVGGLELEQELWSGGRFHVELPISNGQLPPDANSLTTVNRNGKAIRAEIEQPLELRNTVFRGRYVRTDEGFFNPYGSIAVQGQESRAASVETRGFGTGRLSFGVEQEANRNSAVDNQRRTLSAKLTQTVRENLWLEAGIDRRVFEDHGSGQQIDSDLISAGLKWKPASRLETSIRREQNLGEADPTYPTQTLLGAQYQLTSTNRIFATQRFSSAPITPIGGAETSGVLSPRSTRETAIGVESRLLRNTNLTTNYRMDTTGAGTDSFAVLGVLTRLPIRKGLSLDWTLDNAMHLAGFGKGYVGGSFGFTESKDDKLRMSARYEIRRGDTTQGILTAGIVGRLSSATSAMARFRTSNQLNDGQVALAVRPKKSDRVAMLFSYDFGNAALPLRQANPGRTDRLSADALIQISHGFEFYSRVAEARTAGLFGGISRRGTYAQGRLQKSLSHRFDIAGEARWIRESVIAKGALITGVELGTWITPDFRIGLGYSSRGFANPGALLNSTASRGGTYLVISSKLSNIFDLMGGSDKTK